MIKNILDLLKIVNGETENIRIAQGKYKLAEKNILDLLKIVNGETENIRIAQGKYKLAESFSEGIKQTKNKLKWQQN